MSEAQYIWRYLHLKSNLGGHLVTGSLAVVGWSAQPQLLHLPTVAFTTHWSAVLQLLCNYTETWMFDVPEAHEVILTILLGGGCVLCYWQKSVRRKELKDSAGRPPVSICHLHQSAYLCLPSKTVHFYFVEMIELYWCLFYGKIPVCHF